MRTLNDCYLPAFWLQWSLNWDRGPKVWKARVGLGSRNTAWKKEEKENQKLATLHWWKKGFYFPHFLTILTNLLPINHIIVNCFCVIFENSFPLNMTLKDKSFKPKFSKLHKNWGGPKVALTQKRTSFRETFRHLKQ